MANKAGQRDRVELGCATRLGLWPGRVTLALHICLVQYAHAFLPCLDVGHPEAVLAAEAVGGQRFFIPQPEPAHGFYVQSPALGQLPGGEKFALRHRYTPARSSTPSRSASRKLRYWSVDLMSLWPRSLLVLRNGSTGSPMASRASSSW